MPNLRTSNNRRRRARERANARTCDAWWADVETTTRHHRFNYVPQQGAGTHATIGGLVYDRKTVIADERQSRPSETRETIEQPLPFIDTPPPNLDFDIAILKDAMDGSLRHDGDPITLADMTPTSFLVAVGL